MLAGNVIYIGFEHFECQSATIEKPTKDKVIKSLQEHNKELDFMINDRLEEIEILRDRQECNIEIMEELTCQTR